MRPSYLAPSLLRRLIPLVYRHLRPADDNDRNQGAYTPDERDEACRFRDGLLVRRGGASGLLLPQVAPESHWGPRAFLTAVCRKAGLSADAWREPGTLVFTFQAEVFSETREAGGGMGEA